MVEPTELAALLLEEYGMAGAAFRPLPGAEKPVYRVQAEGAPGWVLRVYPSESEAAVAADATVLAFLERRGYPAERVVPTRSGAAWARRSIGVALLSTFVNGRATGFSPADLRRLGAALGRLHALPLDDSLPLPRARMLPRGEIAYARSCLAAVADRVPAELHDRYAAVEAALDAVDWCEDLPDVLVHNDCHPGNSVRTPDGRVVLVDWEGAGRGPAVVDLGFLLVSGEITAFGPNRLRPDPRRLAAIVDGYREHRAPELRELERLPSAVRFRSLVAAAGSLARRVERRASDGEPPWWWARYLAADEIAARVRRRFEERD